MIDEQRAIGLALADRLGRSPFPTPQDIVALLRRTCPQASNAQKRAELLECARSLQDEREIAVLQAAAELLEY